MKSLSYKELEDILDSLIGKKIGALWLNPLTSWRYIVSTDHFLLVFGQDCLSFNSNELEEKLHDWI